MIYPKFLKKGDTIGVPAPSSSAYNEIDIARFKNAIKHFNDIGYKLVVSKNLYKSSMCRSASAEKRAKELNEMFDNNNINMILCAAGGEFLIEILPYVEFDKIVNNPKFVQGFSDPTGLLYVITTKYDIATIYAMNFKSFGMEKLYTDITNNLQIINNNIIMQNSFELFENERVERTTGLEGYNLTTKVDWKLLKGNKAHFKGRIIGGCLDIISEIAGTKYDGGKEFVQKYKDDGIIWYFDNCELSNEEVIRTLWKFNELGYFKNTSGIIFGRFGEEKSCLGYTIKETLKDSVLGKMKIPIVYDADISHKGPSLTVINGAIADVIVRDGKGCLKLELL